MRSASAPSPAAGILLTGSPATLNTLDRDAFKMGNVDGTFQHSTLFALVDRQGFIRGYYHTEEGVSLDPSIAAIRRLAVGQASTPAAGRPDPTSPPLNAVLNGTAAVLLVWGYTLIRRGHKRTHRNVMLAAFTVSTAVPGLLPDLPRAGGRGAVRRAPAPSAPLYFAILITHTLLAAAVPPLADRDPLARPALALRPPSRHRALDAAHLALRQRHGRGCVLDAVPDVARRPPKTASSNALK